MEQLYDALHSRIQVVLNNSFFHGSKTERAITFPTGQQKMEDC
jgi:hypothetical protein